MAYTTIDDPSAYFKVQLWTGNVTADRAITFDDTDTDMQPDFIWIKNRETAKNHIVVDSVRGVTKYLYANGTEVEGTDATRVTSVQSDGFTIGESTQTNANGEGNVAWCWKESATSGFDIVTYTGNGTDDTDISHNLSAVPHLIIVKNLGANEDWNVYHHKNTSAPETDFLELNDTDATADAADRWSDEVPTSSVFTIGDNSDVNQDATGFVAYLFSEKQGYSKFGTYTGNGNADGTFVYTGFRPAMIIFKKSSAAGNNWGLFDNKRTTFNEINKGLKPDADEAEYTANGCDFLSNGVKMRSTGGDNNESGSNYIYMAFAEAPLVNSNGVPCNAR